ncbi:MAG: OmpA family protein [Desulfobacter sp.]
MDALLLLEKYRTKIFFVVIPIFIVFFYHTNASGFYERRELNPDIYSVADLKLMIEEHQAQVKSLDEQIRSAEKNLDWLVLKINRISDSERKIPHQLKSSTLAKKKKIELLKKQKSRLGRLINKYEKFYEVKKRAKIKEKILKSEPKLMPAQIAAVTRVTKRSSNQDKVSNIEAAVKDAGLEDWVEVLGAEGECLKINSTLPILFSSGSAVLAKGYQSFLKKFAHFLKPYDVRIHVTGLADSDPINTKRYPSNFELGASRAANVAHEMIKSGLRASIFKIDTTGEYWLTAEKRPSQKSFQRTALITVSFRT